MKFEEALSLLRKGEKVRDITWPKGQYIYIDKEGFLVDNTHTVLNFGTMVDFNISVWQSEWESEQPEYEKYKEYINKWVKISDKEYLLVDKIEETGDRELFISGMSIYINHNELLIHKGRSINMQHPWLYKIVEYSKVRDAVLSALDEINSNINE